MGKPGHEPSKRELLESLLSRGMVLVHIDARASGVDVPPGLRGECELGLNLSYRFQGKVTVDEAGVVATLSFAGEPYACALPFDAVYAMVAHDTGENFFFPADAPPTALAARAAVLEQEASEDRADASGEVEPDDARPRPALSIIDGGKSGGPDEPPPTSEARGTPDSDAPTPVRPGLRLVE